MSVQFSKSKIPWTKDENCHNCTFNIGFVVKVFSTTVMAVTKKMYPCYGMCAMGTVKFFIGHDEEPIPLTHIPYS